MCYGFLFLGVQGQNALENELDSYLSKLETKGFSGSILVAQMGEILLEQGYGYANKEKGIENTPETVFDIGSITKQFTGAAILHLEMEGKLRVENKLSDYFEEVPEDKLQITLHHLLTHSAGFPGAIGPDYQELTTEEFVKKAMQTGLKFEPGSQYRYSNVGYSLLGIILEKISGQSYEAYLRKHLWLPARMAQTGYLLPSYPSDAIAFGYQGKKEKNWGRPIDKKWGEDGPYWHLKANGGVLSNLKDMYAWHQALLGNDLLDDSAKAKYFYPHVAEGPKARSSYGYGWVHVPTPRNTTLYMHNGGNGIFFADFLRYIDEGITIILLSNHARREDENLAFRLAKIVRERTSK